jgi:hypothetical protein
MELFIYLFIKFSVLGKVKILLLKIKREGR